MELADIKEKLAQRGYSWPENLANWTEQCPSFPAHHFKGNAMSLPFYPSDFVYSPVISAPVKPIAEGEYWARYERGVKKYQAMLQRGEPLPPVTLVVTERCIGIQDGGHRFAAAQREGTTELPCQIAVPKTVFKEWVQLETKPKGVSTLSM